LTIFGATAVSMMVLAYALERRHHAFIALFALACGLSSAYAMLIGSLPFAAVEALWSAVALRRFRNVRTYSTP
jgi:hypothetical protein